MGEVQTIPIAVARFEDSEPPDAFEEDGVDVQAGGNISLLGNARIESSTSSQSGKAGDIDVVAGGRLTLSGNGLIDANTFGAGDGGA